ncbi:MAG: hypothetical protein KJO54_02835 [Gammaproteobacteria bacterium]|nr:hypothetical protein [Gammaproteobacteria bacterium]NNF62188.1 hypothetical protein [Gammaproteobacteria bacterium]NNM20127.1 hypothetical protein [Gammaproteobacteria bacterium]
MHLVGIVAAMPLEARALRSGLPRNTVADLGQSCAVHVCGIGAHNARRAADALLQAGARALVSWGTAGGLVAGLASGTVVVPAAIVGIDRAWETDARWRTGLVAALGSLLPVSDAPVYSGGLLIDTEQAKQELATDSGAVAVDMESAAIAAAAEAAGIPFICVRVVADPVSAAVPDALKTAIDDKGFISTRRLLRALAMQPGDLLPMLHLGQQFRRAASSLRQVAATVGPRLRAP